LDAIITHFRALAIGEHDLSIAAAGFFQPRQQHGRRLLRQRRAAFLSPFSNDMDMSASTALNILRNWPGQAGGLKRS
jgi:hypothetical protein